MLLPSPMTWVQKLVTQFLIVMMIIIIIIVKVTIITLNNYYYALIISRTSEVMHFILLAVSAYTRENLTPVHYTIDQF